MRKSRFFQRFAAVLLAVTLIVSFGFSVYAAPDGEGDGADSYTTDGVDGQDTEDPDSGADDPVTDEPGDGTDDPIDTPAEPPADNPDDAPADTPTEAADDPDIGAETADDPTEEPTQEEQQPDYGQSSYTEPEHLDELPTVADGEVVQATAVVVPPVKVSNASLFSGIVMWLCVAVGIAVVVGVLVSKRTRRRGS